jgi:hypothetical protein
MIDLGRVANGDVIRTKGVDFREETHGYCAQVYYENADGGFKVADYLTPYESTSSVTRRFDENGNLTMTLYGGTGARYLKICGYGFGANLVVTINEEIVDGPSSDPDVPPSYTNLVPTATDATGAILNGVGYIEGKRWSSSSTTFDTYKDETGYMLIGMMPYTFGQTIRIKGASIESYNWSNSMFRFFKADRSNIAGGYLSFHDASTTRYPTEFTVEGDTIVFAPTTTCTYLTTESAYVAIVVKPTNGAENVIVTVDQEIV